MTRPGAQVWRVRRFREEDVRAFRAALRGQPGAMDAAAVRRFMAYAGPLARLERARVFLRLGDVQATRRELAAALTQGGELSLVRTIAGVLLFRTHDYHEALEHLRAAIAGAGASAPYVLDIARERAGRIGWHHEELELLEEGLSRRHRLPWVARAAELHEAAESLQAAATYYERVVAERPDDAAWRVRLARVYARQGIGNLAASALDHALSLESLTSALALQAARAAVSAGDFPRARRALERARELGAEAAALAGQAQLAVWAGDTARARELAARALELEDGAPGHRVLGVCAALEGDVHDARARLDDALARDPDDVEALTWSAELRMRAGELDGAAEHNERAGLRGDGYSLTSRLLQLRITLARGDSPPRLSPACFDELRGGLLELVPEAARRVASGRSDDAIAALDEALTRLRGNRSEHATFVEDGELVRIKTRTAPRYASRTAQLRLRCEHPDPVFIEYSRLVELFEHSPLVLADRGELKLWLGDLEGAARDLEGALEINAESPWPHIALILLEALRGAPARGLEHAARAATAAASAGASGPSLPAYRGEALRLLGRVDEAIVDLEQAIRARPRRISAIINLALARRERGELAATRARFLELATRVPGLMSDATRECGRRLYAPTPAALTDDDIQRILARALVMLRGNRGSTLLTYFTGEGRLRLAPIFDRDAIRPEALEREDHELIERLLDQAYGVAKGKKRRAVYRPGQPQQTRSAPAPAPAPTRERPPPHRPTTLTPEELEHFIARGYVTIRDGFARARAQAWVDDSIQRVRDDPARWVKMYLPGDPSRDLRGFDPARPETWTWARMDVEGRLRAPIAEFAPRVWGAICDLLGGPERVRTREWTNYFAVNVKGGEGRPWAPPTLDAPSWHFDDPSVDTRFETYRHGLIVLSYFSDVAPRGGGTYVAPESVAIAARELAAHPDGMNWLDRTVGPRILERCSEFVELTGPVGTVTLCHPFMLHSASTNAAGVVRFLGNTVIDMTEPFNLQRDDPAYYTPVERALLRALGRPER